MKYKDMHKDKRSFQFTSPLFCLGGFDLVSKQMAENMFDIESKMSCRDRVVLWLRSAYTAVTGL